MSRSKRKHPIAGMSASASDKREKQDANRKERKRVHATLTQQPTTDLLPHKREVSDVWSMPKDGKWRFDAKKHPKLMRK
jgi:hypothetical protein